MNAKHKALAKAGSVIGRTKEGKLILAKPRRLTPAEHKAKQQHYFGNVPKHKELSDKEKTDYQHRTGRGYNE